MFRVLDHGGRLVIETLAGPLPPPSWRRPWLLPPIGPAMRVHTSAQMERMYERAGFTNVQIQSTDGMQLSRGDRPPRP